MNRATPPTGWARNPDGSLGWIWNPFTGCRNHDNGLCRGGGFPCYAYRLANGRLKQRYLANENIATVYAEGGEYGVGHLSTALSDPFYPRFWEERMSCQFSTRTHQGIFVCDMSDLFGIGIPEYWTWRVMQLIKANPQHRFYLLTKQPQNLARWSPFPDNCYVGVTATGPRYFAEACNYLRDIEAPVKFLSIEPYLEEIIGSRLDAMLMHLADIKWLIIGGQTNPEKLPRLEWLRQVVSVADKADIRVFLKDNLKPLLDILDITETGFGRLTRLKIEVMEDAQGLPRQRGWYGLRQEMPEEATQCKGS